MPIAARFLGQLLRRRGEQHLASVSGGTDAGGPVHAQAHVAFPAQLGLARVQAHAHLDLHPFGPGVRGQVALRIDSRGQGVGGRAEGDEERVALRVDDASLVSGESGTQKLRMLGENLVVAVAPQLLEQGRRALDIGEDESNSARRKFMHRAHIFVQAGQKS